MSRSSREAARPLLRSERIHALIRLVVLGLLVLAFGRASYHAVVLTEQALRLSGGATR
jgi:hypothetical protein